MSPVPPTPVEFSDTIDVDLLKSDASDEWVIKAAKVSTRGTKVIEEGENARDPQKFIDMLMGGRHGSPFEHVGFTWFIDGPLFMWSEFMRHRIASYNQESGRYKQLRPKFYAPSPDRNLTQTGKPGAYIMAPGTAAQYHDLVHDMGIHARNDYGEYEALLEFGIAREVARMLLPVNIYSSAFVTMNARALMNFLSLRTIREGSHFPSFPMREIEMAAEKMENDFAVKMPLTYAAFNANGRVAP